MEKSTELLVKDLSIYALLKGMVHLDSRGQKIDPRETPDVYNIVGHDIVLPKANIPEGTKYVTVVLEDETRGSRKKVMNLYKYVVTEYDDLSTKLNIQSAEVLGNLTPNG